MAAGRRLSPTWWATHALERPALADHLSGRVSYGDLLERVAGVATRLGAAGVRRTDCVAGVLPRGGDAAIGMLGAMAASAYAPLDPRLSPAAVAIALRDLRAKALVVDASRPDLADVASAEGVVTLTLGIDVSDARLPEDDVRHDVALVLHTSGSSAAPKIVSLTHENLQASTASIVEALRLQSADVALHALPWHHIHGISVLLATLSSGGTVVCLPAFEPDALIVALAASGATWYSATPAMHRLLCQRILPRGSARVRHTLRFVRSASAALSVADRRDLEAAFGVPVLEAYGMTEAGPHICSQRYGERNVAGSVGLPSQPLVRIVDAHGRPCLPGTQGEITIAGANVVVAPRQTAGDAVGLTDDWLHTGDEGYLDASGHLFVTGRLDDVINRGGEKISPARIELVLRAHPDVADAVVFPVPHETLGHDVAAAVVPRRSVSETLPDAGDEVRAIAHGLHAHLRERLQAHEVPETVLVRMSMPWPADGKPRRSHMAQQLGVAPTALAQSRVRGRPAEAALGTPKASVSVGVAATQGAIQASSDTTRDQRVARVSGVVSEVLGLPSIGEHDDIFALGADSVGAAQIAGRVGDAFGVRVPAEIPFVFPTVRGLAEYVEQRGALRHGGPTGLGGENTQGLPLTPAQHQLWLLNQLAPDDSSYRVTGAWRVRGALRVELLEKSFTALTANHEALRAVFRHGHGAPAVTVTAPLRRRIPVVDVSLPDTDRPDDEVEGLVADFVRQPFALDVGPLIRALVIRLDQSDALVVVAAHHIACDLWSMRLIERELWQGYSECAAYGHCTPRRAAPSLRRVAARLAALAPPDQMASQRRYWQAHLSGGVGRVSWPTARRDASAALPRTFDHAEAPLACEFSRTISPLVVERLTSAAREARATAFMAMLTAFELAIAQCAGTTEFLVAGPVSRRAHPELELAVGMLVHTVLFRAMVRSNRPFAAQLAAVRDDCLAAFRHADVTLDQVVSDTRSPRDGRPPLVNVMFAFQNVPDADLPLVAGLGVERWPVRAFDPKFDLALYVDPTVNGVTLRWRFDRRVLTEAFVSDLADTFTAVVERAVTASLAPVDAQRRQLRQPIWPRQGREQADIVEIVDAHAGAKPFAIAIEAGVHVSYRELVAHSRALAAELAERGVTQGSRVGVCITREARMGVALLAVLRLGAAVVPIDPRASVERVTALLGLTRPTLVLHTDTTSGTLPPSIPTHTLSALVLGEAAAEEIETRAAEVQVSDASDRGDPGDSAYVIATSGSTAAAKAVVVTRGNLAHYVYALSKRLDLAADDRYLHTAPFTFSSSMRQWFAPWAVGGTVVLASDDDLRDPEALIGAIRRTAATVVDVVPTRWRSLTLAADRSPLPASIRLALSASESLSARLAHEICAVLPAGARFFNMYGLTETTGIVSTHEYHPAADAVVVPVGTPIEGVSMRVVDAHGGACAPGESGQLVVEGPTVAAGYLPSDAAGGFAVTHRIEKSAESDARFSTGDLGRMRADGLFEHLGRIDDEVQVGGVRISVTDVEAVLARAPGVAACAVVPAADDGDATFLSAFVVRAPDTSLSEDDLRQWMQRHLVAAGVPSHVTVCERLPLTENGKVDRRALVERAVTPDQPPTPPVLPSDLEALVARAWSAATGVVIDPARNVFEQGANSLHVVEVVHRLRQEAIPVTAAQLFRHQTVHALASSLAHDDRVVTRVEPHRRDLVDDIVVDVEAARRLGHAILDRAGLDAAGVGVVTDVQLEASLRGQITHNLGALPRYAQRLRRGVVNGRPRFRVIRESEATAVIDADNGPGQWSSVVAMEMAVSKARTIGVGVVGVRGSNHFGAAGHYAWLAARQGFVGLCTTNSVAWLPPAGGTTPLFGTNPLAMGVPAGQHHPLLLDVSMSATAKGKVALHLVEGHALERGWILDRQGRPSTDAADLAAGLGQAIGGHKGSGMAMMFEILAGVLTGAAFGLAHARERLHDGREAADFGHVFLVIDPSRFIDTPLFLSRVDALIDEAKASTRADGVDEVLVPGEQEMRARAAQLAGGLRIRARDVGALRAHCVDHGIAAEILDAPTPMPSA